MDLTTLATVVLLAVAALGFDTVWHPTEVILQASSAGKIDNITIDDNMIIGIVTSEVDRIAATPTLVGKPRVQFGNQGGIGMAIATAANLQSVAYALQREAGHQPDQIRISLFSEGGIVKVLVTGSGNQRVGPFEQQVQQQKGETAIALLHRAALVGMSHIDPYLTALSLMQRHASDQDFSDAETLITAAKSQLAPTPLNFERSLFENLQGILALFRAKQDDAHTWFRLARASNPDNTAAVLNLAFADLQLGQRNEAAERMAQLFHDHPIMDPTLASTGYVIWGAALLGQNDVNGADAMLAKAIAAKPTSAIAWDIWSEVKRRKGEVARAEKMHEQGLNVADNFENYAEIAVLYFRVTWQNNGPMVRSEFFHPPTTSTN